MEDLVLGIKYLSSELLPMIDSGIQISVEDFVNKMNDGTIIDYVHGLCTNKNVNLDSDKMEVLRVALCKLDVSEHDGRDKCIETNGLVYLERCLMDILLNQRILQTPQNRFFHH